jgi:prepilin-type N-terminal cleavage/methylation domain-containing protein/prepilin-type processing-associated H-X9-DG protein
MNPNRRQAFSLIELMLAIAIAGILMALAMPEYQKMVARARSVACLNNLRQIGIAVGAYLADNDNTFPFIEPNPDDPVYDAVYEAKPMLTELGPYGVTQQILKCPEDLKASNYFQLRGSSYQWCPILDGELKVNPVVYGRRGGARTVNPARMRLCMDFETVHFNRANRLYADGHVVAALK